MDFPAVVLAGPRQSGKTTLLRHLFRETHRYVSLEPPDARAAAADDPQTFLELNPPPVIIDELQHVPILLPYIRERLDRNRGKTGQYLLTGGWSLPMSERIADSLSGRAAVLRLPQLSYREITKTPHANFPWEAGARSGRHKLVFRRLWESFLKGGHPGIAANPKRDPDGWHADYVRTYLERDLPALRQVGDIPRFYAFFCALAAQSARLLNLTDLARDLGISVNTAKSWVSVLEDTGQVFLLQPYSCDVGARLVRTPKVYFSDVGTLCYLAGLKDAGHAMSGPMGGAIFETAVVGEIMRRLAGRGERPRVHFWRTSTGFEVDLIVETAGRRIPIETRTSATPDAAMARNIVSLRKKLYGQLEKGYVVHPGDASLALAPDAVALPFANL